MARQKTVLLVTKAGLVRNITLAGLTIYGYKVLTAEYAEAAEILRANHRVDVVVVDLDLTDNDCGSAITRVARAVNPRTDFVYTSRVPNRVAAGIRGRGAPILRDPYHPHQLADVISHLRFRSTEATDVSAA
jgi:DNA-binding response OmpR family regulator